MTSFEIPDSDLSGIKDQVVIITGKKTHQSTLQNIVLALKQRRCIVWNWASNFTKSHQTWW
jgi:hypothetical protein